MKLFRNPYAIKSNTSLVTMAPSGVSPARMPTASGNVGYDPRFNEWSTEQAIQEGYKESEWVYVAVSRIARAAASIPWRIFRKLPQGGREPWKNVNVQTQHPIEDLLEAPNPWMNGSDWIELYTQHLYLGGNAINRAAMLGGVPVAFVPLSPSFVQPIPDIDRFISNYRVYTSTINGKATKDELVSPAEILHLKFGDPSNLYWGIAPLKAVARTVDTDVEAVRWNKLSLQNRAVTTGVFTTNTPLTIEQWNIYRQMIREQHQGSDNSYAPWILGFGTDWKPMSMTPQELDFINSRKMNREAILAVFNVPPPVAGLYDAATYNNVRMAYTAFWMDTIIPYLDDVKAALRFYFKQFAAFGTDWILDYDLSGVEALKPVLTERVSAGNTLWKMGVPLNVINERFELDLPANIPYADVSFIEKTVQTSDSLVNPPAIPTLVPAPAPVALPASQTIPDTTEVPLTARVQQEYFKIPDVRTIDGRNTWRMFAADNRKKHEDILWNMAHLYLQKEYKRQAINWRKNGSIGAPNSIEYRKALLNASRQVVFVTGTDMLKSIHTTVAANNRIEVYAGKVTDVPKKTFAIEQNTEDYLNQWADDQATSIENTTDSDIEDILADVEAGDITEDDAFDLIVSAGADTARADTIAGTQAVTLHNYAIVESAKQSEIVQTKVWVSSDDDRVRPSHAEADGQEVGLDELFTVDDEEIEFPGEGDGDTSINCRCTVSFTLQD